MLKFAKVIGANTDLLTAQAFVFSGTLPKDSSDKNTKPLLGVLISASGEDVFVKVRQSSADLDQRFFSSDASIASRIGDLYVFLKEQLEDVDVLQILLFFAEDDVLYIQSFGAHKALLLRSGRIIDLLEGSSLGQLVSGYLQGGDRVLFISARQVDSSQEAKEWDPGISQRLIHTTPEAIEEEIVLIMQQTQNSDPLAAILVENEIVPKANLEEGLRGGEEVSRAGTTTRQFRIPVSLPSVNFRALPALLLGNKKILAVLVVLLVVFLGSGTFYVIDQNASSKKRTMVAGFVSSARAKYEQAQSLKDSDNEKAKQSLEESKKDLQEALKLDSGSREAKDLKNEIDQNSDAILKISGYSDWPIFLSLDLIKNGFNAKKMSYSLGQVVLLDDQQKTVVSVDLSKKTNKILGGQQQFGAAQLATINGDNVFVFSPDKGILKVDLQSEKASVVVKPDPEWGQVVDMFGFGGNIYLLDGGNQPSGGQIWKYVPIASGYSDKNKYLKEGVMADFSGAKSLEIDYSLWVLKLGPQILKFTAGGSDFFSVGGMDVPLGEIANIFVPEDGENIYVLDSSNSRLVVLKKNGQYVAQFKGEKFKTADDLVVDAENKKIYLLEGGKIYQLDLK